MFEYQIIRSNRRKTLGLQVKHGQVTVRAPHHVTSAFIDAFIQEKSTWLLTKVIEQQSNVNYCDFCHGSILLFLGEKITLNISVSKQATAYLSYVSTVDNELLSLPQASPKQLNVVISERINTRLHDTISLAKQVKKQVEKFFKEQAESLIVKRLELISTKIFLEPTKVSIRQYRARWGSCNSRGEVSFNYLLMMTPLSVIDYVIVHELCHLEYLDHSKSFWQLVAKHLPNYKVEKEWLSSHQSELYWKTPV